MRIAARLTLAFVTVTSLVLPRAFGQNLPDLGGLADGALPARLEQRIGAEIMRDIRLREPSYLDDAEITEYLNVIGGRLVAASPDVRQSFEFFAIRDSSMNAFALPGGYIGVHTGLLTAVDSESELASVLAHEVAHVTQRHIARLIGAQQQMQIPTMVALAAALLLGRSRPDLAIGAAAAVQAGAVQSQINYTRTFEREADRIGFQTLSKAGFDAHAMAGMFEKMQRAGRVRDDGTVPSYLRTHPVDTERIADAQNRAATQPYKQVLDSADFHFVRAGLRAARGDARESVASFTALLRDGRYARESAARFGLVQAHLRARQTAEAAAELARLRALKEASPMIDMLAAAVQRASGDARAAIATLEAARAKHPQYRPALYALVEGLLEAGRGVEALAALEEPARRHRGDARLARLKAKTYATLGRRLLQHQAQAEAYAIEGSLVAAIDQLQSARAAADGDFYQLSEVDARLRELRALHAQELKDAKP